MGLVTKIVLIIIAVVIIVPILILGYLGFVPGLSTLFGSDKPRDLGVTHTQQDYVTVYAKAGVKYSSLPADTAASQSIQYIGSKPVNQEFTQSELTARIDSSKWKYQPITDAQVKINPDGTVESSGMVKVANIDAFTSTHGIDSAPIKTALGALSVVSSEVPYYAKGTGSVINNQVNAHFTEVDLGRLGVPAFTDSEADSAIEQVLSHVNGLSVKSATFSNGKLSFDGTMPAEIAEVRS